MSKIIFVIFTILLLHAELYGQSTVTHQRLFDTIPFLPEHYARRVAYFETETVAPGKIIFLGNSITEGANWNELAGMRNVLNRGIGGDVTFGVLGRLEEVPA